MPACAPAAAASGAALPWETSAKLPAASKEAPPALLHPVLPAGKDLPLGLCRCALGIACLSKSVLTLLIATLAVALSFLRWVAALAIHLCLEGHESLYGRLRDRRDHILHRQQ